MVKPLSFKGDKKSKKRKRRDEGDSKPSDTLTTTSSAPKPSNAQEGDADVDDNEPDQSWVTADVPTDIGGPVIFVLPTSPPTCLACDANGKVFASELENMVEGDPSSAEPHDVRQVWVTTKVAGSESIGFKGHHGRYLSCDRYGILSASSAAISSFESFIPIPTPDTPGTFSLQTGGGINDTEDNFISIKQDTKPSTTSKSELKTPAPSSTIEIRGDANSISFSTTLRIRMQARFKPRLKASRESKALEKISRRELEAAVGRKLEDHEVRRLKKARREGNYHEEILDVRVAGKHDKFAS
ncbi:hypothetical protein FQN54_005586 [Arachnomyces sp. PD_36]|nr:hypothetical protein FQN54_005586 [Arachnomyces sp. PD_36]